MTNLSWGHFKPSSSFELSTHAGLIAIVGDSAGICLNRLLFSTSQTSRETIVVKECHQQFILRETILEALSFSVEGLFSFLSCQGVGLFCCCCCCLYIGFNKVTNNPLLMTFDLHPASLTRSAVTSLINFEGGHMMMTSLLARNGQCHYPRRTLLKVSWSPYCL